MATVEPAGSGPTPSLAIVAESAGVSVATVSKVVNGRHDVGAETRERVQRLLDEYHYVGPHAAKKGADALQERCLELVLHGAPGAYHLEVMQGVVECAAELGVTVSVTMRNRQQSASQTSTKEWARQLVRRGRTAIIDVVDDIQTGDMSALSKAKIPLVVVDPLRLPRRELPSVGTTNFSGGLGATRHLIDLGHRRIGYVGGNTELLFSQARLHGYRAALESAGIEFDDQLVVYGFHDYATGRSGAGELLAVKDRPTAIFAATDETAAGVIDAARERSLRVPEDLSVVGFDDIPLAQLISPPLTTVRQPLREMGRVAVRTAMDLHEGREPASYHVQLATELTVRRSTCPPGR